MEPITCNDPLGCVVVRPNSPVRIATLLPMTGDTAVWGQEQSRGINLAISERNNELLEHDIELVPLNSECDANIGLQALQTLSGDTDLLGIIGPACSDVATAVLPTVRRNDWLLIAPGSTAPALTTNQPELAFFRTAPNLLHQATVAAHFAFTQLGMRQTAVFHDETEYNNLLAQQFADTFTQLGGTISYQGQLAVGQLELTAMLDEAANNAPQLIYLALFEPEATLLLSRLAENPRLNRAVLLGADGLFSASFASQVNEAAPDLFVTNPAFTNNAYGAFLDGWLARYEAPPSSVSAAYAYDAAHLLLSAIADVAVVGQNGALVIGRQAVRDRLAATDGVIGASGTLRCSSSGECAAATYGVYEMDTAVRQSNLWPPPRVWQFN